MDAFNELDCFQSLEDVKQKAAADCDLQIVSGDSYICIFDGPLQRMKFSVTINEDFTFSLHLRGVLTRGNLRLTYLRRLSQLTEMIRFLCVRYEELCGKAMDYNDRLNEFLISNARGCRYNAEDIKIAIETVSISRSAYRGLLVFCACHLYEHYRTFTHQ